MPFTPIANTAKIELIGHSGITEQPIVNVMHSGLGGADTFAEVDAIALAVKGVVLAHLNVWSSTMFFDEVRVTSLDTATSPQATEAFPAATQGTASPDAIPGAAALVKLLTATRGRSYRGRIYVGIIAANEVGDGNGTLSVSFQGVVNAYISAIEAALNALTPSVGLVVASRKLGISSFVLSANCEPTVAYQRRRGLR